MPHIDHASAGIWPPAPKVTRASFWRRFDVRRLAARPHGLRATIVTLFLLAMMPPIGMQAISALHGFEVVRHTHEAYVAGRAAAAAVGFKDKIFRMEAAARGLVANETADAPVAALARDARLFEAILRTPVTIWDTEGHRLDAAPVADGMPDLAPSARRAAAGPNTVFVVCGADLLAMFVPVRGYVVELLLTPERLRGPLRRSEDGTAFHLTLFGPEGPVAGLASWPKDIPASALPKAGQVTFVGATMLVSTGEIANAPGFRVIAIERDADYLAALRAPFRMLVVVALASIAIAAACGVLIGRHLTRPLHRITEAARAIAGGQALVDDVRPSRIAEFNLLHESLRNAERVIRRRAAAERLAVKEARHGHELLASVVNATADQILVKDLDLRYVLTNRATLMLPFMRRSEWQVLGRRATDIEGMPDADLVEALDREVIATGEARRRQFEWTRADGSVASSLTIKTPWRNASGQIAGVVSVIHDVTETRRAEQRLAAVQGELLRAARLSAMGAMASGLAHELNQPLAAATNFLNAANRLLSRVPPDQQALDLARRGVVDAAGQTVRAGAIVRRLREFVGRGEADLKPDDIPELIRELHDVARADRATRGSELVVTLPEQALPALVDRTQLQQVLLNLVRNAAEAIDDAPGGRITITAASAPPNEIAIIVGDNGPGIPPEIRDRLFQPFVSTKAAGMGIGLAICRTIIEGHGGTLTVGTNDGGRGACFRIVLPAASNLLPQPLPERQTEWTPSP